MRSQYKGLRPQAVMPTLAVNAGGSVSSGVAGNYYVYLIARNRSGFNLASTGVFATVATGQQLEVTIPADSRRDGEDVQEILVLLNRDTDDPSTAAVVASFDGYQADQITQAVLPMTIILSKDIHFVLEGIVASEAALPDVADRLNGMRREVTSLGYIVEYIDILSEWQRVYPNTFTPYVASSTATNGANVDFRDILDTTVLQYSTYAALGGDSIPVSYWIVNDEGVTIPQGLPVTVRVNIDSKDESNLISGAGALTLRFIGYVDIATGNLDTAAPEGGDMVGINDPIPYRSGRNNLVLPKPLPDGTAYCLEATIGFRNYQVEGKALQGSSISLFPSFAVSVGSYSVLGAILGDLIYPDDDLTFDGLRRVVPQYGLLAKGLPGSGVVNSQFFNGVGEQTVVGFNSDTADQAVIITGNGSLYVQPDNTIPSTTRRRALVSTVEGPGNPTPFSAATVSLSANELLSITINYPTAIRSDYPDVISGNGSGQFNASHLRVYVQGATGGSVTQFQVPIAEDVVGESFQIGGVTGADIGSSVPGAASASFGLFEFDPLSYSIDTVAGSSTFGTASNTYQVAIAPYYENAITEISHAVEDGCIRELQEPLVNLLDRLARALLREEHAGLIGDELHESKISSTFTGPVSGVTSSFVGQLHLKTDVTPQWAYVATSTVAGGLVPIGAEHATLIGDALHESKVTAGFTGDASAATSSFVGQLRVKTDTNPEQLFRATATTAGGLKPVGSAGGGGGGSLIPLDYFYSTTTGSDVAASGYLLENSSSDRLSLSIEDSGTVDISAVLDVVPRRSLIVAQNAAGTKRKVWQTHSKASVLPIPVITSFSPDFVGVGDVVTINGSNFTGVTEVLFTTDPGENLTIINDTQLTVEAPFSPTDHYIFVTNAVGTTQSDTQITIFA